MAALQEPHPFGKVFDQEQGRLEVAPLRSTDIILYMLVAFVGGMVIRFGMSYMKSRKVDKSVQKAEPTGVEKKEH